MTEPQPPGTPGTESQMRPDGESRALAFADVETAKQWANALPLQSVGLVCETVLAQLRALGAATFPPRERATIADVLRDLVARLHTELARRYAGKGQPGVERELDAAEQAIALWQGLWEQYSACLRPLLEGDPELQEVKPKILQRGMYVGKQLVVAHGLARRAVPGTLWHELHAEGAETEWPWERWQGTHEPRDALVVRESDPIHRWMLDQLAIVRSHGVVRVGHVTRVAMGGDGQLGAEGQLALTLRLWSGTPSAVTLLPLSAASSEDPPLPALRFDETPDDKPSLVLRPRTFNPSRVMRSVDTRPDRRYRLTRLLQCGTDFERVAFEETS